MRSSIGRALVLYTSGSRFKSWRTHLIEVKLANFDDSFLKSLPDFRKIGLDLKGIYHTIIINGQKAGVVGYIPAKGEEKTGFVQIILKDDFRGLGLMALVEELLARKYNLKTLLATIKKDNLASIRAHEKSGFKLLSAKELDDLRKKGFLKEDEFRFFKNF